MTEQAPPLVIGYILKMFPRLSETFILNEILEMERRGVQVVIFSMKKPNETIQQSLVTSVKAPIYQIPPIDKDWPGSSISSVIYVVY